MNPLLLILLLGLGAYALTGAQLRQTAEKFTIKLLNIDSVKFEGSEIAMGASIAVDNPTNKALSVKQPYLRLIYNGSEIANSKPNPKVYSVAANDRTTMTLNLRMAFSSIPALTTAILNKSQSNNQTIIIQTDTIINGISVKDAKPFRIADLVKLVK